MLIFFKQYWVADLEIPLSHGSGKLILLIKGDLTKTKINTKTNVTEVILLTKIILVAHDVSFPEIRM